MTDGFERELARAVEGRVSLRPALGDFGGLARARARATIEAAGTADLVRSVQIARAWSVPVVIRGAGHSCDGQTVGDDALVVSLAGGHRGCRLVAGNRLEIAAGTTWREVEALARTAGRSVPILPDFLDLTVGGTLAVGGYGVRSVSGGAQVDLVERLRLVLPNGRTRWCAPGEPLFSFGLATRGALGIIDRVVLRTDPYREVMSLRLAEVRTWTELGVLIDSMLARSLDAFWVAEVRLDGQGPIVAHAGTFSTTVRQITDRLGGTAHLAVSDHAAWSDNRRRELVRRTAALPKLWADHLFDRGRAAEVFALLDRERRAGFLAGVPAILYTLAIRTKRGPDLPLAAHVGGSNERHKVGLGIYLFPPPARAAHLRERLLAWNETLRKLGARPYRYGVTPLNASAFRAVYGRAAEQLDGLARGLDPTALFQPLARFA